MNHLKIYLANPRGFCAGVERAIETVELALSEYNEKVYVNHEIVHNKYVIDMLSSKGAVFVEDINVIPDHSLVIFSAHGVSKDIEAQAKKKKLRVIDATCPLVKKVHSEAKNFETIGNKLIIIGHKNHPEIIGTLGRIKQKAFIVESIKDINDIPFKNDEKISYVTQTTLSIDDTRDIITALKKKYPKIKGPTTSDICFATQNRQNAVKKIANKVEMFFIIGSKNSSNSNRLCDIAKKMCINSHLVDSKDDFSISELNSITSLGITAGASAPDILVKDIINKISYYRKVSVIEVDGIEEKIKFKIPNFSQTF